MAIVLKFKIGDSGTELNLNAGASGFQLANAGWSPSVASPIYMGEPRAVTETINLWLQGSSHDNLAASMQALHAMQKAASDYLRDGTQINPVWLHAKMFNETGERRALVYGISIQYRSSWFGQEATALQIPLVIVVSRAPYWESTTARDLPELTGLSAAAVLTYDYTAAGSSVAAHDIVGDVGARVKLFEVTNPFANGHYMGKFWMGIRSANKHGATGLSNFAPVWEAEDNSHGTDCTDTADSGASGGFMTRVTESSLNWDDEWHDTVIFSPGNTTVNEDDQLGLHLWLLRAKVTSGTWEVYVRFYPFSQPFKYVDHPIIEISNTVYNMHELCVQELSATNLHAVDASDIGADERGDIIMQIYARRTSGTGSLDLDCLALIPVDEGFLKMNFPYNSSFDGFHRFNSGPDGSMDAYVENSGHNAIGSGSLDFENFYLPPGDGRIICAFEAWNGSRFSDITDILDWNESDVGKYYERWTSLRGAE